jgi:hypothetical protein
MLYRTQDRLLLLPTFTRLFTVELNPRECVLYQTLHLWAESVNVKLSFHISVRFPLSLIILKRWVLLRLITSEVALWYSAGLGAG